jgi:ATP-binding cassette, subfamily B, bacterial
MTQPIYKHVGNNECGLVCIKIITEYFGKTYSLVYLRNKIKLTDKGCSLFELSKLFHYLGFHTNTFKGPITIIEKLRLPCIIHWNKKHYVVVFKINEKNVFVLDPSLGKIRYSRKEFLRGWSKIVNSIPVGIIMEIIPRQNNFG